jgi:hypothetical protein
MENPPKWFCHSGTGIGGQAICYNGEMWFRVCFCSHFFLFTSKFDVLSALASATADERSKFDVHTHFPYQRRVSRVVFRAG